MKKMLLVCAVTAALFFGCKTGVNDDVKDETPQTHASGISVSTTIGGKTVSLQDFALTGIPYTATESGVNPAGKLVLTAECSDSSLSEEEISVTVLEPAENPPLTLTKSAGKNKFDLKFSAVTSSTKVKLEFSAKNGEAKSTFVFDVEPEPVMEDISYEPDALTFGKDFEFQLKPKITATPESYCAIPAGDFILPEHKAFSYSSSDSSVASVTAAGVLHTHAEGTCVITISLADKTCTLNIKVDKSLSSIASVQSDGGLLYYGHDVTLTAVLTPFDAVGNLQWDSGDSDATVTKDAVDEKKAVVKVTNKNAGEKDVTITVTPLGKPELKKEVKLQVKTVIPQSISIIGADKMYKSEEVQFTISAESKYGAEITADNSVTWNIWSGHSGVSIDSDGKLKLTNPSMSNGTKITIRAESTLNPSVEAKREITVYDNVASIVSVSVNTNECTLNADESDYPSLSLTFPSGANKYNTYQHFAVSEKTYFSGAPSTDYFEKAEYTLSPFGGNRIDLKPKSHTSGAAKTFYVYPIDPKTGRAVTTDTTKSFTLTIWQEAKGIELQKGNFDITGSAESGYESKLITCGTSGHTFYARIIPEYAKQDLDYTIQRTLGKYTCIQNDKKADEQDKTGWIKYQFDTNSQNTIGSHDKAKFNFTVKDDGSVKTFLEIDSN
ncbi:MAG: hypothetical protein ACTTKL_05680 [Treponema sp.]